MQKPVSSQIPRGVGCPPPPGMDPRKGKGRLMCIKVRMLDDSVGVFHLGHKALGQALFDEVCRHLNLLECDYFGLEFISFGNRCWLDKDKSILRQIMASQSDARFFFTVKFYTPNPAELEEEYTRYLFALQLRRDLSRGELLCSERTAALLVSYIIQSECGDYSPLDYPDYSYVSSGSIQFVPNQSPAFQKEVMEQHKKLVGMTPAEADFNLLETARRCDFYGIRLHSARDLEGIEVALSVTHMGIKMFHQLNCMMTFSWAKIRKLCFKRKRLMIKIHPDCAQQFKETVEFIFDNRDDCKNFWKKCVEHHSFFRCPEPVESRESRKLFHRGSNFHYQGRTQKQLIDYVREHRKRREPFQRPLHRSFVRPLNTKAIFPSIYGNQQHLHQHFFNSDQLSENNKNRQAVEDTQQLIMNITAMANQKHEHFCPKNTYQNGTFMGNSNRSSGEEIRKRENGEKKTRPKSSLSCEGQHNHHHRKHNNHHHHRHQKSESNNNNSHYQMPMQHSCYGDILNDKRKENGVINVNSRSYKKELPISQDNLFHQQVDPMSISLPNVLAPSALQTDDLYSFYAPIKSLSGENFNQLPQHLKDIDNHSEGSYHLYRRFNEVTEGDQQNSSRSDIYSSSSSTTAAASSVDPRVYQTTFTTKRVGNVIVKKVTLPGSTSEPLQCSDIVSTASTSALPTTAAMRRQQLQHSKTTVHSSSPIIEENQRSFISTKQEEIALTKTGPTGSECTSSSACCSDYSIASSSAPTSTRSSDVRRIRYAPSVSGGSSEFKARIRNEIPVAIDYPHPIGIRNKNTSDGATSIIRPILLSCDNSSPTTHFGQLGSRKPLVIRTPSIGEKASKASSVSTINEIKEIKTKQDEKQSTLVDTTIGVESGGPLPGRVICRDDLVITSDGIDVKNKTAVNLKIEGTRPLVAPKPTELIFNNEHISLPKKENNESKITSSMLDPLDNILKDVLSLNETFDYKDKPSNTNKQRLPTAISIESEEQPNLRTLHLFNNNPFGEDNDDDAGSVPYTLTVRELDKSESRCQEETKIDENKCRLPKCEHKGRLTNRQIELVHRSRLPSQDSYSSQDHSISPTTPDSNILEYMLRKRSKSSDRTLEDQRRQQRVNIEQGTTILSKRTERRFTQPIVKQENEKEKIAEEIKEPCLVISSNCLLETDF